MRNYLILIIILFRSILALGAEWETIGDMPFPVAGGQAIVYDSLIYILGGKEKPGILNEGTDIVQVFNPKDNNWYIGTNLLTHRYGFVAGLYNNNIISCGGIFNPIAGPSNLEMWDINNPPHQYHSSYNFNRIFATGHVIGEYLYLIGGIFMGNDISDASYIVKYHIPGSTFTEAYRGNFDDEFPFQQMSIVQHDNIYIFGGIYSSISNKVYKFNYVSNEYNRVQPNLLKERAGGVAVNTESNDCYIIGGLSETDLTLSSVEIYHFSNDDSSNSISAGPSLNIGRRELMAVYFNNSIYVFGGMCGQNLIAKSGEKLSFTPNKVKKIDQHIIDNFLLEDNYPNPFCSNNSILSTTTIPFKIKETSNVRIDIFSILGKHIITLQNDKLHPGAYKLKWDGTDKRNLPVASGVYFYRLTTDFLTISKKLILTR